MVIAKVSDPNLNGVCGFLWRVGSNNQKRMAELHSLYKGEGLTRNYRLFVYSSLPLFFFI
jgi:hypothetical protein